jgi:hypothetical protein
MRAAPPANPYEVYCLRCRVSFPVGTKTCLHCGQRIGRPAAAEAALLERPAAADEDVFADLPARSVAFSPMTFVWLLAAVVTVIYRSCT